MSSRGLTAGTCTGRQPWPSEDDYGPSADDHHGPSADHPQTTTTGHPQTTRLTSGHPQTTRLTSADTSDTKMLGCNQNRLNTFLPSALSVLVLLPSMTLRKQPPNLLLPVGNRAVCFPSTRAPFRCTYVEFVTEQFSACALGWRTSFTNASHNASRPTSSVTNEWTQHNDGRHCVLQLIRYLTTS